MARARGRSAPQVRAGGSGRIRPPDRTLEQPTGPTKARAPRDHGSGNGNAPTSSGGCRWPVLIRAGRRANTKHERDRIPPRSPIAPCPPSRLASPRLASPPLPRWARRAGPAAIAVTLTHRKASQGSPYAADRGASTSIARGLRLRVTRSVWLHPGTQPAGLKATARRALAAHLAVTRLHLHSPRLFASLLLALTSPLRVSFSLSRPRRHTLTLYLPLLASTEPGLAWYAPVTPFTIAVLSFLCTIKNIALVVNW
ncbi:hypothetical protein PVAP13_9KG462638 [Panicum virgatum]|uniref:Uncharacterized protein n=1 Tax=Panicum virgatum TaxID=38727 RepID=A0A8T0N9F6_PANVG|nr:hypothetical protein PVAP13_9KG462638 [Panicum virgatum]